MQAHTHSPRESAATPRGPTGGARTRKLSAEDINRHPVETYAGPIHVIETDTQTNAAVLAIGRETLLGFDTETRPAFRKGEKHPPALLQLAGANDVWIFKLSRLGLPAGVAAILANAAVVKAGVANARDLTELRQLTEFIPRGFVDLGHAAKQAGVQNHGLRGLAAIFLGCRISKGAQLTNWSRPDLPARALQYAATDAWIGRRIYEAMQREDCLGTHAPARSARRRSRLQGPLAALWARAVRRLRG